MLRNNTALVHRGRRNKGKMKVTRGSFNIRRLDYDKYSKQIYWLIDVVMFSLLFEKKTLFLQDFFFFKWNLIPESAYAVTWNRLLREQSNSPS